MAITDKKDNIAFKDPSVTFPEGANFIVKFDENVNLTVTGAYEDDTEYVFDKPIRTTSATLFLGQDSGISNNAGFASIVNVVASTTSLFGFRTYDTLGTTADISWPQLDPFEWGVFQSDDSDTITVSGDTPIKFVFNQLEDAFNRANILRGTQGKLVFDVSVARDPNDDNTLTDAQLLALPDSDVIKLVDRMNDFVQPFDFDNPSGFLPPDGEPLGQDEAYSMFKSDKDFVKGRKLIAKFYSADGNDLTMKGLDLGNGQFVPWLKTYFASRFIDTVYPTNDTITTSENTWSAEKIAQEIAAIPTDEDDFVHFGVRRGAIPANWVSIGSFIVPSDKEPDEFIGSFGKTTGFSRTVNFRLRDGATNDIYFDGTITTNDTGLIAVNCTANVAFPASGDVGVVAEVDRNGVGFGIQDPSAQMLLKNR